MNDSSSEEFFLDDSLFIGVIYDLSQPIYLGDRDYDTLISNAPEAAYLIDVHHRVHTLVTRYQSLNMIYKLLAFKEFPVSTPLGKISRENWVRITLDVLLSRLTSIRDCTFLLIAEVLELDLEPRSVSRSQLKKNPIISSLASISNLIDDIAGIGKNFRDERDYHLHRGEERPLGEDPLIYSVASAFEIMGGQINGNDSSGNPIDLDADHEKIVEQLRIEFTETVKELDKKLHELCDEIYPHFKDLFLGKFALSGNQSQTAIGLIERAEYYSKHYSNDNN